MRLCVLVAALAAVLSFGSVSAAEQCAMSCGVPTDIGSFCPKMEWSVCQTHATWQQQAAAAEAAYYLIANATDANQGGLNTTCTSELKALACAKAFPACEIATEIKRVCKDECYAVSSVCRSIPQSDICSDTGGDFAASNICFSLEYKGPAMGMWFAGLLISVIFSFLAALGINLQKHSMSLNEHSTNKRAPWRQPWWVIGFTLILLGSILDFVAFGLAPQTFLAPLAALSLVWNILLAPRFHNERVTARNFCATVVIFVGVTSTVIFSTHTTPSYQLDDLLFLYTQPVFIVYAILVVSFMAMLYITARRLDRTPSTSRFEPNGLVHIVCYGGLGGTFGGQSVMLAKSTVELVKSAVFEGGDAFTKIPTYLIAISMAITLLCQVSFLNAGLKRFDALKMVPTYQAFWIVSSILGGEMYFEEYKDLTGVAAFMFILGTAITVGGIGILLSPEDENNSGSCAVCLPLTMCLRNQGWKQLPEERSTRAASNSSGMELVGIGDSDEAGHEDGQDLGIEVTRGASTSNGRPKRRGSMGSTGSFRDLPTPSAAAGGYTDNDDEIEFNFDSDSGGSDRSPFA